MAGSVHLQHLCLWKAEFGLVVIKELDQGLHVHGVVQVNVLLGRVLHLGDGDGLTHCREGQRQRSVSVTEYSIPGGPV